MKKFDKVKTVQLLIYVAITAYMLFKIFTDMDLYRAIAENDSMRFLCFLLWAILGISFAFMFFDFSSYTNLKREYSELDLAVFSDPMTGLANRYSCDAFIEQYTDKPLPRDVGCITLDMTNIAEINEKYSHTAGNEAIKDFSNILKKVSLGICFIGRNGGSKFLAIFEECTDEKMERFLKEFAQEIEKRNESSETGNITYKYGKAFDEGEKVRDIIELIALSNKRSTEA
ncbi:MAG: diguanylate cyclase [Lachnospiraceae bacterium]|nr:diguanylate cyclase [Lachnospiraceae bacterium]